MDIEYMGITLIQKIPELQGPASGTGFGRLDGAASLASWMACARVKAWEGSKERLLFQLKCILSENSLL